MKTFILLFKRLFGIAAATTNKMIEEADQKVDIQAHAAMLIKKNKEDSVKVLAARNNAITRKHEVLSRIEKKEKRYQMIVAAIIEDSLQKEDFERSAKYIDNLHSITHEGPLLEMSIKLDKDILEKTKQEIDLLIVNAGKLERNLMTVQYQLDALVSQNALAESKLQIFSVDKADAYFNLEKLQEIVDKKEINANATEEAYDLDHNEGLAETPVNADEFSKRILDDYKDKKDK